MAAAVQVHDHINSGMSSEERLTSIRDSFHSSFEAAFVSLNDELIRAQWEVSSHRDRAARLEQEKDELQRQQQLSDVGLRNLRREYAKLCRAHERLTEHARALQDWITEKTNRENISQPEIGRAAPLQSFTSDDGVSAPRTTSNAVQQLSGPTSTALPTLADPLQSNDPAKHDEPQPPSDPVTESTESASGCASQGALKPCIESDSDVPRVVAERVLKRKRSSRKEPYIKPEPLSPVRLPMDQSTLDLDEVKQPLAAIDHEHKTPRGILDQEALRCVSEGVEQVTKPRIREDDRASSPSRPNRRRRLADKPGIFEDSNNSTVHPSRRPLQPKTPNPRIPIQTNDGRSTVRKRPTDDEYSWPHCYSGDQPENGAGNDPERGPSEALQKLLTPQGDSTTPLLSRPRPSLQKSNKAATRNIKSMAQQSSTLVDSMTISTPTTQPKRTLRMRPRAELRPEDFRHNPERNDGFDYAFSEVVRGRDQRRCLPGCMKPDCCGQKFNRVVEIGGFATPSGPNLGEVLRSGYQQIESDEQILRNYLGESASRLDYISNAEREDILQKAKAQAFAQMHGKHRHQHARPTTPPGFWRTDMPTTQEEEMDKEMAEVQRQRTVEERRQEAIRPGGRWMFRDEYPGSACLSSTRSV